ncbi:CTP synthetase [Xinfangfangia pollutisoli]|uniref:CTP synthetase n=1 Tax=Xinfangfangia pollutisoli TaxID=2865960 RepID=UPI001CD257E2|nr:CTP synthetase [Xinfangfangia pollutisoli]
MHRLFMILYSIIGTSLAGAFVVAALVLRMDTLQPIIVAAAVGAVLALPVAWMVARRLAG